MKKTAKLLRTKIPSILKDKGESFILSEINSKEELVEIIKKELIESTQELNYSDTKMYHEVFADIIELLEFLMKESKIDVNVLDANMKMLNDIYGKYESTLIEVKKKAKRS